MTWIIANGAPKSGSTWIFQLLQATGTFSPLPDELQSKKWNNDSVDPALLERSMRRLGASDTCYLTKQHWPSHDATLTGPSNVGWALNTLKSMVSQSSASYDELLTVPSVKVCNIIRDIRDVTVSLYHHKVRKNRYKGSIEQFIDRSMDQIVKRSTSYHRFWIESPKLNQQSYFITSYEYLLDGGQGAVNQLYDFCELGVDAEARKSAYESCQFENKKETGPGKFFRKGMAFGFSDEISTEQANRILNTAEKQGLRDVKRSIAEFNPVLRPYLETTDVGL